MTLNGDFTAAELSITGLETIEVTAAGTVTLDSSVLHDQTFLLADDGGAGGVATATIDVIVATGTEEFDASGLEINDTIDGAFLGLDITVSDDADVNIVGSDGNDTIEGNDGDDTISGGLGVDALSAGTGDNVFVFADGDSGIDLSADLDVVTGFNFTADSIDLGVAGSLTNYDEATGAADFSGAFESASAAFADSDGDLLYFFATDGTDGWLFVDFDQDGDVDMSISLTGVDDVTKFGALDLI